MNKKEWREVSRQSLYFVLAVAAIALLIGGIDLVQGRSFASEKFIIMLGLGLLMFSMFLGLSPFALDSKQKGMEYLLTLPYSRRRLLLIKLLPRLAGVVLFYLAFALMYGLMGSDAFGDGFTAFSLAYFALFFISFSLAVVHENFIVQSIWAGIALCGYMALCLFICALGFAWKFGMPSSWLGSRPWQDLAYDLPTLLTTIAVFLLMAVPFVVSLFLAFKKFDLKPTRFFNRRQLLLFIPMLLLTFAAALGITYFVQKSSGYDYSDFYILRDQRLLKVGFPGKLVLYDETSRRQVDTKSAAFWDRLLLEKGDRLYLCGYDSKDETRFIGCLNLADLSWKILHRCPTRYFVVPGYQGFRYDGESFVYLRRIWAEAELPGIDSTQIVRSDTLELVRVDPASGKTRVITFRSPLFRNYYEPWIIGCDQPSGQRFWLVAHKWSNVLRLWEDGRIENLGLSKGFPAYAGGLLFTRDDHSLVVRRLLGAGSETVKEIDGKFWLINPFFSFLSLNKQMDGIYAERNKRIVRIDLATLAVDDVGPRRGQIFFVQPGNFYYSEYESWLGDRKKPDRWRKIYRLQGSKMVFLKQLDFRGPDFGHVWIEKSGVTLRENGITRIFAFPDLRELKFKKLN